MTSLNVQSPNAVMPDTVTERSLLVYQTAEALHTRYGMAFSKREKELLAQERESLIKILGGYSDETLRRISSTANTAFVWLLSTYLHSKDSPDEEYVNDWITIEMVAPEDDTESVSILSGLTQYERLVPQENGHYPAHRTNQVTAIYRATSHLNQRRNGVINRPNDKLDMMKYIEDKALRDLITTHEDPAAVADIIVLRDVTDPSQITALMETANSTANSLSNGIL